MAWYNTGSIALTNGSATVTGSGTNFLVGAQIGEALYAPDGKLYEIQTINSATVITLASNYLGSTATGQSYQIIPTQSLVADLASDVTDLISDFANVRDYAGNGKFNDGAVGTPGITFTQDQDNGLYRIGANNWALAAGGIKQVDLSATDVEINYAGVKKLSTTASGIDVTGSVTTTGNVGIGASSPNSYDSRANNLVVGDSGDAGVTIFSGATSDARLQFAPINSTGLDNGLIGYDNNTDVMTFATAGSDRLIINSTGNVGIGVVPPSSQVSYVRNVQIQGLQAYGHTSVNDWGGFFTNSYIDAAGLKKYISSSQYAHNLHFDNDGSFILYNAPNTNSAGDTVPFQERMRIDTSGNLLVGGTSAYAANAITIASGGIFYASRNGGSPATLRRNSDDGAILTLEKDNAAVGSIGSRSGVVSYIVLDPRSGLKGAALIGGSVDANNGIINPGKADGDIADDAISLGSSSSRFKNLYLSGNANVDTFLLKEGASTVGGLYKEKDVTGIGTANDPSLLGETGYGINFMVNGNATKVARLDTSGNLLVGTTTQINSCKTNILGTSTTNVLGLETEHANDLITGNSSATEVFRVAATGNVTNTNNSYGSLSDARLKSNVVDASSQLDDIMAVQVRSYTLDSTGETHIGVVAQELEASGMSSLVEEDKEGMKSVKYSVLYMKALKALQEAVTRIEILEAKVAQLES